MGAVKYGQAILFGLPTRQNISRGALERHLDIIRIYVRNREGVYALYRRDKLYYVGLARNLRMRLAHHLRDRHGDSWDRFITIGDSHSKVESLILRIVKPKGNKQTGKLAKCREDLKRRFGRDMRERYRKEIGIMLGSPIKTSKAKPKVSLNGKQPVYGEISPA